MQYLKYPTKNMRITQDYNGSTSHKIASTGSPKSYPIDEGGANTGREYFYAPCDLTIKRIYGVNDGGTNTVWLQSNNKVKLANGKESYVTLMIIHMNDSDLEKLKVGQKFEQGDKMFLEGKDNATGYHFHIEVATCKYSELKNNGWVKNSKGAWVISNNAIKPEYAFYLDNVKVIEDKGLKFKQMPKEEEKEEDTVKVEQVVTNQYYPIPNTSKYPKLDDKSIVDCLKMINVDSSFTNRMKIAKANGITLYLGTSSQNTKLLTLLKQGKLKKA